jgi:hypothetical protein
MLASAYVQTLGLTAICFPLRFTALIGWLRHNQRHTLLFFVTPVPAAEKLEICVKAAGVKARFHDSRHPAVTTMAEAGFAGPDNHGPGRSCIAANDEALLAHRRQALNQAAAALQPNYATQTAELVN